MNNVRESERAKYCPCTRLLSSRPRHAPFEYPTKTHSISRPSLYRQEGQSGSQPPQKGQVQIPKSKVPLFLWVVCSSGAHFAPVLRTSLYGRYPYTYTLVTDGICSTAQIKVSLNVLGLVFFSERNLHAAGDYQVIPELRAVRFDACFVWNDKMRGRIPQSRGKATRAKPGLPRIFVAREKLHIYFFFFSFLSSRIDELSSMQDKRTRRRRFFPPPSLTVTAAARFFVRSDKDLSNCGQRSAGLGGGGEDPSSADEEGQPGSGSMDMGFSSTTASDRFSGAKTSKPCPALLIDMYVCLKCAIVASVKRQRCQHVPLKATLEESEVRLSSHCANDRSLSRLPLPW